jgi:hypothetical protein
MVNIRQPCRGSRSDGTFALSAGISVAELMRTPHP